MKRAQILLAADRAVSDAEMAATLRVGTSTVYRTKQRFVEHGLARALSEEPRPGGKRKLAAAEEALLIATACDPIAPNVPRSIAWPSFHSTAWSGVPRVVAV